jgi:hypothetical protein
MRPRLLIALVVSFLAYAAASHARAQPTTIVADEVPIALNQQEFAGFERIFFTTGSQPAAAKSLTDGANTILKQRHDDQVKLEKAWQALPMAQHTPEAQQKHLKDLAALEPDAKSARMKLLTDLRALLNEKQKADWPRFERFLRRARWQNDPTGWGAEKTNILALADMLDLDPSARTTLGGALDHYDRELDALLINLESTFEQSRTQPAAIPQHDAARRRLTQLNDSHSTCIRALLPESKKPAWDDLYQQATLTETYGLTTRWMDLAVRDAANLRSLTDDQRAQISDYLKTYTTQYDALTAQLAAMERALRTAASTDQPSPPDWDPSRTRRSSLLLEAQQKLKAMLSSTRWDRIVRSASASEQEWDDAMVR